MSLNISEEKEFSKEKYVDYMTLEIAFSKYLSTRCWLASDANKKPFNPKAGTSEWGNPHSLCTFKEMEEFITNNPGHLPCMIPGVGELIAIDLDKINTANVDPPQWAVALVERLGSYCEISQSGTGLHVLLSGKAPGTRVVGKYENCKIEFLTNHPLTLTGKIFKEFNTIQQSDAGLLELYQASFSEETVKPLIKEPRSPKMTDDEVINLCRKAANKSKFEKLFDKGDLSNHNGDDSSGDMALCSLFAFYTQDIEQIDRLFQKSALHKQPDRIEKWGRPDYKSSTIKKAIESCSSFYQPKKEVTHVHKGSWEQPLPLVIIEDLDHPFPLASLPMELRQAVEETARFSQTDPALPLIPGLGQLCLQIGRKALIEEKIGLLHHPSLFLVGAAGSGERKSGVDDGMIGVLKTQIESETPEYEKKKIMISTQNELIEEQVAFVKKQLKEGKISIEEANKQAAELRLQKQKLPHEPINFCDDITPPRVFQKLYLHGGAYGIFSSDGRKIFNRLIGKGNQDGATGEDIYISAVWGDMIYRSRVSGGKEREGEDLVISKPALTAAVYIQLDLWEEFLRNKTMRESGLISRICMVNPTSRMGFRLENEDDKPLNYSLLQPYADVIMNIRQLKVETPLLIKLSPQAARERRDYFNAIEKELGPGGAFEDVKDIATRNTSITARIAGAFCIFEAVAEGRFQNSLIDSVSLEITEEQWLQAQSLGEYFLAQAIDMQRIYGRTGKDHLLKKAAIWLKKEAHKHKGSNPCLILGSILANRVRGIDPETVENEILVRLETMGWVRKTHTTSKGKFYYEVNLRISDFQ